MELGGIRMHKLTMQGRGRAYRTGDRGVCCGEQAIAQEGPKDWGKEAGVRQQVDHGARGCFVVRRQRGSKSYRSPAIGTRLTPLDHSHGLGKRVCLFQNRLITHNLPLPETPPRRRLQKDFQKSHMARGSDRRAPAHSRHAHRVRLPHYQEEARGGR